MKTYQERRDEAKKKYIEDRTSPDGSNYASVSSSCEFFFDAGFSLAIEMLRSGEASEYDEYGEYIGGPKTFADWLSSQRKGVR